MESFVVAMNAVMPFLIYISLGYFVKVRGIVDEPFLQRFNKMIFKVLFPFMTFYNVYKADANSLPQPRLMLFAAFSLLALEVILVVVIPRFIKTNPQRGVFIQAIYRSNFILFGLPLTVSLFGDGAASIAAMVVTIVVSIYNITSVIILELFNGDAKTDIRVLLKNVATNPLLDGAVVGLIFFFFQIKVPACLLKPIAAFSDMTAPLALFVLGGTLHFDAIRGNAKYLVSGLFLKLLVVPAVMVAIAYGLGMRNIELFILLAMYATPVATASYPMAQNMGGDGELAGQFVVISTVVSVFTMFLWIFFMRGTGLIWAG